MEVLKSSFCIFATSWKCRNKAEEFSGLRRILKLKFPEISKKFFNLLLSVLLIEVLAINLNFVLDVVFGRNFRPNTSI